MKTISSLVTKKHQLQDQKSKNEAFPCNVKIYINTELNIHFPLYFFRIISSTDELGFLLPGKICNEKFVF